MVDAQDVLFGELHGRYGFEQTGEGQLLDDAADPHRRFHVAHLVDVVNGVTVADHQRDRLPRVLADGGVHLGRCHIAEAPQPHRVVPDRIHHGIHVIRRDMARVLSLQDGPDHAAHEIPARRVQPAQPIVHQVGQAGLAGLVGLLVGGPDDRTGAVALVEFEPRPVVPQQLFLGAKGLLVGQALVEKALAAQLRGLVPHPVVERPADPSAGLALFGGNPVEITQFDPGLVQQDRKAEDALAGVLGHEEGHAEAFEERVVQMVPEILELLLGDAGKARAHDRLDLLQGGLVDRQDFVIDASDAEHGAGSLTG